MSNTNRSSLKNIKTHAAQTRLFLSNKMKPERERSVCRALLRTLGVSFNDSELIAPTVEPADVAFQDAKFQVRDLLRGRKRGNEWKKIEQAKSIVGLLRPYSPPDAISLASLVPEVTTALSEKAAKYGVGCKGLDAVIYVDLNDAFLEANAPIPDTSELEHQGWRSVSLLFSPYGVVLFARSDAPSFLQNSAGRQHMKWENIVTLFEP